jgi:hypothetical protein
MTSYQMAELKIQFDKSYGYADILNFQIYLFPLKYLGEQISATRLEEKLEKLDPW